MPLVIRFGTFLALSHNAKSTLNWNVGFKEWNMKAADTRQLGSLGKVFVHVNSFLMKLCS